MKTQLTLIGCALITSLTSASALANKPLEFKDVFDFKSAKGTQLSENGQILSLSATPYRGNATGQVYSLNNNKLIAEVERGTRPTINKMANWVVFTQVPTLLEKETTKKKSDLKNNLVLVNTQTGEQQRFNDVKDYVLANNGQWLAYRKNESTDADDKNSDKDSAITADKKDKS